MSLSTCFFHCRYIYSVPGKGSFAVDVNEVSGKHIAEIYGRLDIVLKDFDIAGESRQHIADYVLKDNKMLPNTRRIEEI